MNTLSISSLSWSPFTNLLRHKGCSHKHIIGELSKTSFWEGVKTERVSKHILLMFGGLYVHATRIIED